MDLPFFGSVPRPPGRLLFAAAFLGTGLSLIACTGDPGPEPAYTTRTAPDDTLTESPLKHLPPYIERLTHFGQRGRFAPDGERILFLEKTFGDAYEVDVESGTITPVTHHFYHEGFVRAKYLPNGDYLLAGDPTFDAEHPMESRHTQAELWVMDSSFTEPPQPLGTKASEGPAIARNELKIAWTIDHGDYPDSLAEGVSQIWTGRISYEGDSPYLVDERLVVDTRDLPFEAGLETQDFRPPDEREIIFSAYGYQGTEVMGVDLDTGEITNYSQNPYYQEPEGILPSGKYTLVEADNHSGGEGYQYIDIYEVALDGSGETGRVTFFNRNSAYKSSNPSASWDGRYLVFQMAKVGDPAGVGRGLFLYDREEARRVRGE